MMCIQLNLVNKEVNAQLDLNNDLAMEQTKNGFGAIKLRVDSVGEFLMPLETSSTRVAKRTLEEFHCNHLIIIERCF